jgi:lysozyme
MENNIRIAYRQLVQESILNAIAEGIVDDVNKAARLEQAKKTHEAVQNALAADKIVTIRARKQPRFEDPAVDVNLVNHQGKLMLVDPRGVAKEVHTIAPGETGHITVHFKEKGGRAGKMLHLHGGHGAIGDMIETEKDASPYRVSLIGGKMHFKGLPDLSENFNYCYECELQQRLEEALFKKKVSPIKTALAGAAAGAIAFGAGALAGKQHPIQTPVKTAVTQAIQKVGSGKVAAQVKQEAPKVTSHGLAAEMIAKHEGFQNKAYNKDGHWTIGFGNTHYANGEEVKAGDTITREDAMKHFTHHLENVVAPKLSKLPHWDKMTPHQQAALMSFSYNVGENFYGKKGFESITKSLSDPDNWNNVPGALAKYNKSQGKVLPGLTTRRKAEGELWSTKQD